MRLRYAALRHMVVAMGIALVGCGSDQPLRHAPAVPVTQSVPPGAQAPATVRAENPEKAYIQSLYADPKLDPIRDKVPLQLRADAIGPEYLRNTEKPSAREKQAIKDWLQIREKAQQYQASVRGQPSTQLRETRIQVTKAITQLYAGRLTYGSFAARLMRIDMMYQSALKEQVGRRD